MSTIFLGVNYGSANIKIGMVSMEGEIIRPKKYPICVASQKESLTTLDISISDYLGSWEGQRPSAIGIGLTGKLDIDKGIWVSSLNANIKMPVPLAKRLTKRFQLPVYIDNDVHAATLAENYYGIGRITQNYLLINVDAGIAAGIVCDGRLITGSKNSAGEFGHMCVEYNKEPCICGHRGCLEKIASEPELTRQAVEGLPLYPDSALHAAYRENRLNSDAVFTAAQNGDKLALKVAQRVIRALGIGIVNLVNLLNPEHIVFTGSVIRNEWFFEQVRQYVYDSSYIPTLNALLGFSMSSLSTDDLEICGAACLCWLRK